MGRDDTEESEETQKERIERNWDQLLQELRVTQTGVQLLTGFLLTLPFQQRFLTLTPIERTVYIATTSAAALAAAFIIAPVAFHRLLFRQHVKERLVGAAHLSAGVGLCGLALAVVGVVWIIFDVVWGSVASTVASAITFTVFLVLWVGVPLVLGRDRVPAMVGRRS